MRAISPSFYTSLRKKNLILKCLVFPWKTRLWEIAIVVWLWTRTSILFHYFKCKSHRIFLNHNAWLTAAVAVINSASTVDCATISCFLEHHKKNLWTKNKTIPRGVFHVIKRSSPISVRKFLQLETLILLKLYTKVDCSFNVSHHSFCCF